MSEGMFYPILRELEDRKLSIQVYLAEGGAKTPEEYWRKVGEYAALIRFESELKDLEQRYVAD
jgi:hypothetical protein